MPVTKTAQRALRSSLRKQKVNKVISTNMDIAMRLASRDKDKESIKKAVSSIDKAAKKRVIHPNKAARLKSRISKIGAKGKKS